MTTKRQTNCNEPATSRRTFFPLKPALAGGFQAAPRQCALSGAEPANWRGDKFFRRRTAHWGWVAGLHSTGVITAPVGFTRLSPPPEFSSPTKINFTICPDDRDERESDAASVGASEAREFHLALFPGERRPALVWMAGDTGMKNCC